MEDWHVSFFNVQDPPVILCKVCGHNDYFHRYSGTVCAPGRCDCSQMVWPRRYFKHFDQKFLISPRQAAEFIGCDLEDL